MKKDIAHLVVSPDTTISEGRSLFEIIEEGILLICDKNKLLGVVTDGDFRRSFELNEKHEKLIEIAQKDLVLGSEETSDAEALSLMQTSRDFMLLHLPIVDCHYNLLGLKTLKQIKYGNTLPTRALVMAGGYGSRLGELTKNTPKPMLKVNNQPILEIILRQLKRFGILDVYISTHYLPEVIEGYFKDGKDIGLNIQYLHEDDPLGTGGALSLLPPTDYSTLIINGDVLSSINITSFVENHLCHNADITVAARAYDMQVPYGVLKTNENQDITELHEKPVSRFLINSGIYLISPNIIDNLAKGQKIHITDIIEKAILEKKCVKHFVLHESWLDVGLPKDYAMADKYYKEYVDIGNVN